MREGKALAMLLAARVSICAIARAVVAVGECLLWAGEWMVVVP